MITFSEGNVSGTFTLRRALKQEKNKKHQMNMLPLPARRLCAELLLRLLCSTSQTPRTAPESTTALSRRAPVATADPPRTGHAVEPRRGAPCPTLGREVGRRGLGRVPPGAMAVEERGRPVCRRNG